MRRVREEATPIPPSRQYTSGHVQKASPLVFRWKRYWQDNLDDSWDRPGVYVVYDDGLPVYVGQSERVRVRLLQGHRLHVLSSRLKIAGVMSVKIRLDRRYGERLMREARLIRRLKPKLNLIGHDAAPIRRARYSPNRTLLPHEIEPW